jgi:hypothetical protein
MKKLLFSITIIVLATLSNAHATCTAGPSGHCVTMNWLAPTSGGAVVTYNVYHTTTTGACLTVPATNCTLVGSTTTNATTYTDASSSLVGGTTYFYVVTGVNSFGEGPTGPQFTFTTQADVPGPVSGMSGAGK